MSLNVGELVGYLRLDMGDFESGVAKGTALADKLDGKNVDVKVDADTAGAEAKLLGVAAAEKEVAHEGHNMNQEMDMGGSHMGMIIALLATLGPMLVPIAAGAVGLAAGFGAMGVAGVAAVFGIIQQMKAGTPLGLAYTAMLTTLKGDLTTLGRTAASGTLAPFQQAVGDLQQRMPVLNSIVGEFSVITGKTAGVLVSGLVAGFISFAPLARDAGVYILTLSQRFAAMMSGPGVVTFGDYVRSVFPQVMQAVESIVAAVFHLVAAIAPLGMGSLGILRMFTDLILALPTEHLALLVQTASSMYLGFKLFGLLSGPLDGLKVRLLNLGVSAEVAAAGVRSLTIAAGVIGAIIAVGTFLYSAHAESVRKDQDAVNSLTDALIRSKGVIDDQTVSERANALAKDGTLAAAKQLGINIGDVTAASLGNADALARVNAGLEKYATHTVATSYGTQVAKGASNEFAGAVDLVSNATKDGVSNLDLAKAAYDAYNIATAKAATGGDAQAAAQQALAAKIGTTSAALVLATAGQQATADATALATAKMYVENDAAGLLKQALDLLNGKAISAAQAQNSFDSSLVNMGDHVNATGKKITFTTTSIKDMSSASVALRGQLTGQVTNLEGVAEANRGLGKSDTEVRNGMIAMRKQIIDNAVAHGVDRAAVTAFIDSILKIPKTVPPIPLEVKAAAALAQIAAFKKLMATIPTSRTISLYLDAGANTIQALNYLTGINKRPPGSGIGPGGAVGGLIGGLAGGGLLTGPGTSTSDSITGVDASGTPIVRVSRDEFVVNAAAYARNKALVNAINDGRQGFAGGGALNQAGQAGQGGPLVGLAIEGTLDMGNGLIGVMRGVVKSELAETGAKARYAAVS